jgi:hypothetical protein
VYQPSHQNRFVGAIYYWKYCPITEPRRQKSFCICPWFTIVQHLLYSLLVSSELKFRFLRLCLCQVISLVVICWGLFKSQAHLNNKDTEVKRKPRLCARQIMRDNVQAGGPEDYFKKSITVPFLGYILNEMKTRCINLHPF